MIYCKNCKYYNPSRKDSVHDTCMLDPENPVSCYISREMDDRRCLTEARYFESNGLSDYDQETKDLKDNFKRANYKLVKQQQVVHDLMFRILNR